MIDSCQQIFVLDRKTEHAVYVLHCAPKELVCETQTFDQTFISVVLGFQWEQECSSM